jgi:transposase InsO family protein
MSRKGCCYDNAAMESFFATLKTECFQNRIPENHAMLFDYIAGKCDTTKRFLLTWK